MVGRGKIVKTSGKFARKYTVVPTGSSVANILRRRGYPSFNSLSAAKKYKKGKRK
jgi:hypothetical protein